MSPESKHMSVVSRPQSRLFAVLAAMSVALVLAPTSAHAQPKRKPGAGTTAPAPKPPDDAKPADAKPADKGKGKPKTFDFTGIDLSGQNRSPQLLYFLERANEELERASLEKRSFIPEMVRSIEEDRL